MFALVWTGAFKWCVDPYTLYLEAQLNPIQPKAARTRTSTIHPSSAKLSHRFAGNAGASATPDHVEIGSMAEADVSGYVLIHHSC